MYYLHTLLSAWITITTKKANNTLMTNRLVSPTREVVLYLRHLKILFPFISIFIHWHLLLNSFFIPFHFYVWLYSANRWGNFPVKTGDLMPIPSLSPWFNRYNFGKTPQIQEWALISLAQSWHRSPLSVFGSLVRKVLTWQDWVAYTLYIPKKGPQLLGNNLWALGIFCLRRGLPVALGHDVWTGKYILMVW